MCVAQTHCVSIRRVQGSAKYLILELFFNSAKQNSLSIRRHQWHQRVPCSLFRCCTYHNLQRSVGVEVKSVATDAGRAKFVHLLRYSLAAHC